MKKKKQNPATLELVEIYPASRGVVIQGMQKKLPGERTAHKYRHKFKSVKFLGADRPGWYLLDEGDVVMKKGKSK